LPKGTTALDYQPPIYCWFSWKKRTLSTRLNRNRIAEPSLPFVVSSLGKMESALRSLSANNTRQGQSAVDENLAGYYDALEIR